MLNAVIDTNILVSALLSPSGSHAKVFDHALNGNVELCFDSRIILEYQEVIVRSKFAFNKKTVNQVIDFIVLSGISIVPEPISEDFVHEDDKMFYEVARSANAYLVTGNIRHYPENNMVVGPKEFLDLIYEDLKR